MSVFIHRETAVVTIVTTLLGESVCIDQAKGFSVQAEYTVDTYSAQVVAAVAIVFATGVWTKAAHGLITGLKVQLTTTDTLPAELSLATDYYVIRTAASTFKIAASLADAIAGTAVTLTDSGVGDHTVTATALAGAVVKVQTTNSDASDSGITPKWTDLADPQTVTASGFKLWNFSEQYPRFMRLHATLTAGSITLSSIVNAKG